PATALLAVRKSNPTPCVLVTLDLTPHLDDARVLRAWRELVEHFRRVGGCMVMIDYRESVAPIVATMSTVLRPSLPNDEEIEAVVRQTLRAQNRQKPLKVSLNKQDTASLLHTLRGLTARQIQQVTLDAVADDRELTVGDLDDIIKAKRGLLQAEGLLEFVDAPISLDDIGGLNSLKTWLARRSKSFSPEAIDFGLTPPRGMLLLGVQGAGKSLSAKAVATGWKRPLLRLDPCVLYDKFVGESERRLRDALRQADAMAPLVLWIDEIEKAFASAAAQSTDGGLSQRMFGTFLTWLQEHRSSVFVVATANTIEALPPELLRKGRFDEVFFVDLPSPTARLQIFKVHITRRKRDPSALDLPTLVEATHGYSGAEIEQAVVSELHTAFDAGRDLTTQGLLEAIKGSPPLSVTMAESIEQLRDWARTRCVPAD
ncbi:MAG: AAA family ATPase, partial [Planctomycetota bacterium]